MAVMTRTYQVHNKHTSQKTPAISWLIDVVSGLVVLFYAIHLLSTLKGASALRPKLVLSPMSALTEATLSLIAVSCQMENIMLESPDEPLVVKLIDFGLSKVFTEGDKMRTACGTVYTMAPEVML